MKQVCATNGYYGKIKTVFKKIFRLQITIYEDVQNILILCTS